MRADSRTERALGSDVQDDDADWSTVSAFVVPEGLDMEAVGLHSLAEQSAAVIVETEVMVTASSQST